MNQIKRSLTNFHLLHSLYLDRLRVSTSLHKQMHFFSRISPLLLPSVETPYVGVNQKFSFSSTPASFLEIFSSEDWRMKLDEGIRDSNLVLSHETVTYMLKKLSKSPEKASKFFRSVIEENKFQPTSPIYSLMLRIYANKEFLKEFWVTVKEMKENGYYLDEDTYKTLLGKFRDSKLENEATALKHFYKRLIQENAMEEVVNRIVEVIKSSEWGEEVERKLGKMTIEVSYNLVLRVFKELKGKGHPLKAHRFFKWVEKDLGFKHSSVTYNGMLRILCWEESINEFWCIMDEMKAAGFEMDLDTYIKVARNLQKNRMLKDAVKLYELMMDGPFKPSLKECNMLMRTIATQSTPDLDLVFKVADKFDAGGHLMCKSVYDGIHRSLTSLGKFEEADKIVETMRNAGFEPDNITYSQLVFGLCKSRMFDEAVSVLDMMEEQGCIPDIKTWTILIKGHCNCNEIEKALVCFTKMIEKNVEPDSDLLDVLINGFLSQNRVTCAHTLLLELVHKFHLKPWQATYNNLIQKLLGVRKLEEALELLRVMKKQKYPPFPEPFVQYISKFGSVEDAWEFLMSLSVKEYPSISAYQNVFKSFFVEDRYSEAKDLLFKCPHHIRKHQAICSMFDSAK